MSSRSSPADGHFDADFACSCAQELPGVDYFWARCGEGAAEQPKMLVSLLWCHPRHVLPFHISRPSSIYKALSSVQACHRIPQDIHYARAQTGTSGQPCSHWWQMFAKCRACTPRVARRLPWYAKRITGAERAKLLSKRTLTRRKTRARSKLLAKALPFWASTSGTSACADNTGAGPGVRVVTSLQASP